MQAFLDRYLFFLEFLLFAGIVLGFAIWQYLEVSPKKGDKPDEGGDDRS